MGKTKLPDFKFEIEVGGQFLIIGVDEVGRGALAGPVVAGAVAICHPELVSGSLANARKNTRTSREMLKRVQHDKNIDWLELGIDDSKKLTPKRREKLVKIIKKNALWGIGEVSVSTINRVGIVKATEKAMRKAVKDLRFKIHESKFLNHKSVLVLVDAFHVKYIPSVGLRNQKAIVKGDQKAISIAAASIVAKVYRDKLMTKLHKKYPKYGWKNSKGYGTKEHWEAINRHGASRLHRREFID